MKRYMVGMLLALGVSSQGVAADGGENLVIMKNYEFSPQEITVKRGETVRWENNEKRQYHSVWFEALGEEESDYLFPEESYEREFSEAGTFPYRCGPHERMTGVVHVTE